MKGIELLEGLGIMSALLFVVILLILPLVITIIVGVALANMLGFTGIVWWAFVILFYITITAILNIKRE